jgi:agmatinase
MNKRTYAGIPEKYAKLDTSKVVLIPVPFDGTINWQKGAVNGPKAFLDASENMELYDIETDSEVYKNGIFLADDVIETVSAEKMVRSVHATTKEYIRKNKFVTLVGGEHSISIGSIRAFNECFDNLTVVHVGAHANVRTEFEGTQYHNACALSDASQSTNLIQIGIRSMDTIEKTIVDEDKTFYAHEMVTDDYWMENAIDLMTNNVFLSFNLNALDMSLVRSTSYPEPGGLFWYETLEFLQKLFKEKNVVGIDLTDLCPNDNDKASNYLASKLYYKMLSYKFDNADEDDYENESGFSEPNNKTSKFQDEDYE